MQDDLNEKNVKKNMTFRDIFILHIFHNTHNSGTFLRFVFLHSSRQKSILKYILVRYNVEWPEWENGNKTWHFVTFSFHTFFVHTFFVTHIILWYFCDLYFYTPSTKINFLDIIVRYNAGWPKWEKCNKTWYFVKFCDIFVLHIFRDAHKFETFYDLYFYTPLHKNQHFLYNSKIQRRMTQMRKL